MRRLHKEDCVAYRSMVRDGDRALFNLISAGISSVDLRDEYRSDKSLNTKGFRLLETIADLADDVPESQQLDLDDRLRNMDLLETVGINRNSVLDFRSKLLAANREVKKHAPSEALSFSQLTTRLLNQLAKNSKVIALEVSKELNGKNKQFIGKDGVRTEEHFMQCTREFSRMWSDACAAGTIVEVKKTGGKKPMGIMAAESVDQARPLAARFAHGSYEQNEASFLNALEHCSAEEEGVHRIAWRAFHFGVASTSPLHAIPTYALARSIAGGDEHGFRLVANSPPEGPVSVEIICHICKGGGHTAAQCPSPRDPNRTATSSRCC